MTVNSRQSTVDVNRWLIAKLRAQHSDEWSRLFKRADGRVACWLAVLAVNGQLLTVLTVNCESHSMIPAVVPAVLPVDGPDPPTRPKEIP